MSNLPIGVNSWLFCKEVRVPGMFRTAAVFGVWVAGVLRTKCMDLGACTKSLMFTYNIYIYLEKCYQTETLDGKLSRFTSEQILI